MPAASVLSEDSCRTLPPSLSSPPRPCPPRNPDTGQSREARHLLEELQLGGILQELPHGSRAIVGHEVLLTEGDWLPLGNGEGESLVRGSGRGVSS